MPARRVKTFKKELGHRMHRDHRTRREPLSKRQKKLRSAYRKKKESIKISEFDQEIKRFL